MFETSKRPSTTGGQHAFSRIPSAQIERSQFDRSCGTKTTFNAGLLTPIFVDEALPGDTITMKATIFARMATLLHPIMDNMYVETFFFSVPNRLIWTNWQRFMGEQDDPDSDTDFEIPQMDSGSSGGYAIESLSDYFGIPTGREGITHSSLWHRAYNLIWNEWFRDENLQDSVVVDKDDGPDDPTDYVLLRRGKRHDYFSSCLPWPQKGDSIELPLGATAPLVGTLDIDPTGTAPSWTIGGGGSLALRRSDSVTNAVWSASGAEGDAGWADPQLEVDLSVAHADLSAATAATINSIRQAVQMQRLLERDARGGTRYTEVIRSHFGVTSDDARLQRPEFLGGGTTPMIAKAVEATADSVPLEVGELRAIGVAADTNNAFTKSFTEHCTIIGMIAVRADLNYQQGLPRMFSRLTRYDYYWPALAHIGEQAVYNKEIYALGSEGATDDDVWGYQERYAEYRYKPSMITGEMRSSGGESLDTWHLAQDFDPLPTLGATFIEENPPVDRIISVTMGTEILLDSFFSFKHARPMPTFSVPGQMDHF